MILVNLVKQSKAQCVGCARSDRYRVMSAGFGPFVIGINSTGDAIDHVVIDPVLNEL